MLDANRQFSTKKEGFDYGDVNYEKDSILNTLILIIDHPIKIDSSVGTIIRCNTIEHRYDV